MKEYKEKYFIDIENKKEMAKRNINFFYILANDFKKDAKKDISSFDT